MATTITVDGVWGPNTEKAFCEVIGSWAYGTPSNTTNITTALGHLKYGAARDLQLYLNGCYYTWWKIRSGDVNAPNGWLTMAKLNVDGVIGAKTLMAFGNDVAFCAGVPGVNLEYNPIFADYPTGHLSGGMKIFQEWINAANGSRTMNTSVLPAEYRGGNLLVPYKRSR